MLKRVAESLFGKVVSVSIDETPHRVHLSLPSYDFSIPGIHSLAGIEFLPGWEARVPELRVVSIPGAIINTAREEVFATREKVIGEFTTQKACPLIGSRKIRAYKVKRIKKSVAHLSLSGLENNYYHWCVECLGRLTLLRMAGIEPDFYIVSTGSSFQREYLDILGVPRSKIIPAQGNAWLQADEVIVPSLINNWEYVTFRGYRHWGKRYLPYWIGSLFRSGDARPGGTARLYVSRGKAEYRRLLNEKELLLVLAEFGYQLVCSEDYSVSGQIELFSSAEVVVGVHGAGLANIVHCKPGTIVCEILPQYYHDPSIRVLAQALGHEYRCIVGETRDTSVHPQREDLELSSSLFKEALSSLQGKAR